MILLKFSTVFDNSLRMANIIVFCVNSCYWQDTLQNYLGGTTVVFTFE